MVSTNSQRRIIDVCETYLGHAKASAVNVAIGMEAIMVLYEEMTHPLGNESSNSRKNMPLKRRSGGDEVPEAQYHQLWILFEPSAVPSRRFCGCFVG